MNALVDSNPDDTVPTLKMVKVQEEPVTPPGARSIPPRPRAVQETPGIKRVSLQQSGQPMHAQATPVVRQEPQTEPESGQPMHAQVSPVVRQVPRTEEPEKKNLKSFSL